MKGTSIGPYQVLDKLGVGGMGEVWRARDTQLGREVALKALPVAFAADPDRLMRFEREARTLAALNHPHIAQIYGLVEAPAETAGESPRRALVMELVEGEDLAARITRGPVPIDEALAIARQIAEALEAAHENGVVHRDLKPANVRLRPDGAVKVLDFGLATLPAGALAASGPGPLESPTFTAPALTAIGVIVGTAAYMAPEQARGRTIDRRADIWAFGLVLREMLTGRRVFDGESTADVLAAVLSRPLDDADLPRETPPAIRQLLARCLQREPSSASARTRASGCGTSATRGSSSRPQTTITRCGTSPRAARASVRSCRGPWPRWP
jgi:eukaryotic-like serine/threonine-protein kinase